MKKIITYGTFDLFHIGHLNILKYLKSQCDVLIVGVSSDEFNEAKGKKSFCSYEERSAIVASVRYVDMVIKEDSWEQKKEDILKYKVDSFAIGDDWLGEFDSLNDLCEVIYIPRTKNISTTKIKKELSQYSNQDIVEIEESIKNLLEVVRAVKAT